MAERNTSKRTCSSCNTIFTALVVHTASGALRSPIHRCQEIMRNTGTGCVAFPPDLLEDSQIHLCATAQVWVEKTGSYNAAGVT